MNNFRMSWYDFENCQFIFNGVVYQISTRPTLLTNIIFLLNIHRGRFVDLEDIIEFLWYDQDPDKWPENQKGVVRVSICRLKKILPDGVTITSGSNFGYKLEVKQ